MDTIEYINKWGTHSLTLLISRFMVMSPRFEGDEVLKGTITECLQNLETALTNELNSQ